MTQQHEAQMRLDDEGSLSFLGKLRRWVAGLFSISNGNTLKESLEEVIEEYDSNDDHAVDLGETTMLRNVLSFAELDVEDVMIPRGDILGIDDTTDFETLKQIMMEKAHTRLPVFHGTLDDVLGFIHMKDVVRVMCTEAAFDLTKILRQVLFVPPSMRTSAMLLKMQASRVHMAIVVDEYGGTCGLVTLEDLVEEIVGEIEDEHDRDEEKLLVRLGKGAYEASARLPIAELEEVLNTQVTPPEEEAEYDTLGGLLFHLLGRVPVMGEVAYHESAGLEFEILDADPRRIKRVRIRHRAQSDSSK